MFGDGEGKGGGSDGGRGRGRAALVLTHVKYDILASHCTVMWGWLLALYLDEVIAHYNSFRGTFPHKRSHQVQLRCSSSVPLLVRPHAFHHCTLCLSPK